MQRLQQLLGVYVVSDLWYHKYTPYANSLQLLSIAVQQSIQYTWRMASIVSLDDFLAQPGVILGFSLN